MTKLFITLPLIFCFSFVIAKPIDSEKFSQIEQFGFKASEYTPTGDEELDNRIQKGLDNILTGKSIPFPMPLFLVKLIGQFSGAPMDPQYKWTYEGSVPHPLTRESGIFVGAGDAIYEENGVKLITKTCFSCHSGNVAGTIVAGLGNSNFDQSIGYEGIKKLSDKLGIINSVSGFYNVMQDIYTVPFPLPGIQRLVERIDGRVEAYKYVKDFLAYANEIFLPPMVNGTVRGDNHGAFAVWYAAARIASALDSGIQLDLSSQLPEGHRLNHKLPTMDPLPWWNIKFKDRAYWFWDAPGHSAQAFNLNFYTYQGELRNKVSDEQHIENLGNKVQIIEESLEFARATHSPPYPKEMDNEAIQRGMKIYNEYEYDGPANYDQAKLKLSSVLGENKLTCVACHGKYEPISDFDSKDGIQYKAWSVDFPNLGLMDVNTDSAYNDTLQHNDIQSLARKLNCTPNFYVDNKNIAPFSYEVFESGYTSPVLVGLWASAPYLHNGSVPTLADLFKDPQDRPQLWGKDIWNPWNHDWEKMGLKVDVIPPNNYSQLAQNVITPNENTPSGFNISDPNFNLYDLKHGEYDPASKEATEFRRWYLTTEYGRGNSGHDFGSELEEGQKKDLIAFLTAITGKNVNSKNPVKRYEGSYDYPTSAANSRDGCELLSQLNYR